MMQYSPPEISTQIQDPIITAFGDLGAGVIRLMQEIRTLESRGNNAAVHVNPNGTVDYGALQVNSVHGFDAARLLLDPLYNAMSARHVYDLQGPQAWSTYPQALSNIDGSATDYGGNPGLVITSSTGAPTNPAFPPLGDLKDKLANIPSPIDAAFNALGSLANRAGLSQPSLSLSVIPGAQQIGDFFDWIRRGFTKVVFTMLAVGMVIGGIILYATSKPAVRKTIGEGMVAA